MTQDEKYEVQYQLHSCDGLRQDCRDISAAVKKLSSVTRGTLERVREQDLRLKRLEISEKLLTEHMDDMRVLITNARDDIRKAAMRFEHFDNKLDAHVVSENMMQKRILAWVIATLMMCMIGIAGWIFDYVLKP